MESPKVQKVSHWLSKELTDDSNSTSHFIPVSQHHPGSIESQKRMATGVKTWNAWMFDQKSWESSGAHPPIFIKGLGGLIDGGELTYPRKNPGKTNLGCKPSNA